MSYDDEEPISEKIERANDLLFDLIDEYDSKNGTDYGMPTSLKKENLPLSLCQVMSPKVVCSLSKSTGD